MTTALSEARIPDAPSPPLPDAPVPSSPVPKIVLPLPVLPSGGQERGENLEPLLSAAPIVPSPASGKAGIPERPDPRGNSTPPPASVASAASRFTLFLPLVTRNYDPTLISPRGGAFSSPDGRVTVTFPPGAVARNVRVRYEARPTAQPEGFAAGAGNFSLEAVGADDGRPVKEFGAPLEIRARYDDTGIPRWLEQRLHLYYHDGFGAQIAFLKVLSLIWAYC